MRVTLHPALLLLLLAACGGSGSSPIIFEFPPNADHGTEILTVDDGKTASGFAIDLEQKSVRLPLELAGDETAHFEALIYEKTPEELNQKLGPLSELPEGTTTRPPDTSFQATLKNGRLDAWALLDSPSDASMRFLPSLACATFRTAPAFVGAETGYTGAAAIDQKSALLIANSSTESAGHFYIADEHDVHPVANLLPAGYSPGRIISVPGGRMFISAYGGVEGSRAMFAGDPTSGFHLINPRPMESDCFVTGMDYARTNTTEPAIYTLDGCGNIDRYERGTWTTLRHPPMSDYGQKIAWVGPDELVFFSAFGTKVRHYKNGKDEETTTDLPIDQLVSMATIDGFGTFAGMQSGWVLKYSGTTWNTFRSPFIATIAANSFAGFAGNLLIAGTDGDIQHWVDPDFCEDPTYVGINLGIADMVPLEFGIVATGVQFLTTTGGRQFFAAVLKRDE